MRNHWKCIRFWYQVAIYTVSFFQYLNIYYSLEYMILDEFCQDYPILEEPTSNHVFLVLEGSLFPSRGHKSDVNLSVYHLAIWFGYVKPIIFDNGSAAISFVVSIWFLLERFFKKFRFMWNLWFCRMSRISWSFRYFLRTSWRYFRIRKERRQYSWMKFHN